MSTERFDILSNMEIEELISIEKYLKTKMIPNQKEEEYIIDDEIDIETIQRMFPDVKEPENYLDKTWKNIKKKNVKRTLIELYCIRISDTISEARELSNKINLHISFNKIKAKDIIFENGRIEKINLPF